MDANHASGQRNRHKVATAGVKGGTTGISTSPNVETTGNHRFTQEPPGEGRVGLSPQKEMGEPDPREQAPRMAVSPPNELENCQQPLPTTETGEQNAHKEAKEVTTLYETCIIYAPPPPATEDSRCQLQGSNAEGREDYTLKQEQGHNTQTDEPDGKILGIGPVVAGPGLIDFTLTATSERITLR